MEILTNLLRDKSKIRHLLTAAIDIPPSFGSTDMHQTKGTFLEPWPRRLTSASPRLEEIGISADAFRKDTVRPTPILQFCLDGTLFFHFGLTL